MYSINNCVIINRLVPTNSRLKGAIYLITPLIYPPPTERINQLIIVKTKLILIFNLTHQLKFYVNTVLI